MIYHYPTGTAIFTPSKCGSSSLRRMVADKPGEFLVCTGPAPWDSRDFTFHVQDARVKSVHQQPIRRKVLLFREPVSRIVSLWKHHYHLDPRPFPIWLRSIEPTGHWLPMTAYATEAKRYIRMRSMAGDMSSLFGGSWPHLHVNESAVETPDLTEADRELMREMYAGDFELYRKITSQIAGSC